MHQPMLSQQVMTLFKRYIELDTSLSSGENYPKAITLLSEFLASCGFKNQIIKIPESIAGPNRVNLISRRWINNRIPTLVIYNHIDVVPASYDGAFSFSISKGKAYGRGTSDHKGSTIAVLDALFKITHQSLRFNIIFLATTDEETDQEKQLEYLTSLLTLPKDMIIFNPDTFAGGVTIGHLGLLQFDILVKGKSAHSGMSNLGKNAVEDAGKLISFFGKVKQTYETLHSRYPTFQSTGIKHVCNRCNVNMISGGTAGNIIADSCKLTVDCRYIPEVNVIEEKQKLFDQVDIFCKKENILYDIVRIKLMEGDVSDTPLAHTLTDIYHEITGEKEICCVMGSSPVAQWAKRLKISHFGIGVARADSNIHGVDEHVHFNDIQ